MVRYVQQKTMSHLVRDDADGLHAGAVQVALELAGLDELVFVDVLLHLLDGSYEVVVDAVHLVVALRPRRVCTTFTSLDYMN